MHKHPRIAAIALFAAAVIFVPGLLDRCVEFLIIGAVPYTNITLSPTVMLIIYALFLAAGVYVIASELFIATNPVKREIASRNKARRKVRKLVKAHKATAVQHTKKHYQSVVEN